MNLRAIALLMAALPAYAGEYQAARIDGDVLTISSEHGDIKAPKTEKEQAGFTNVHISQDGNTVGWVTLQYAGASYPYAVKLVLFRNGKVAQRFFDFGTVKEWAFSGDDAVLELRQFPHGPEYLGFIYRRISDGALLGRYECGYYHDTGELIKADRAPDWARPFEGHCPQSESE